VSLIICMYYVGTRKTQWSTRIILLLLLLIRYMKHGWVMSRCSQYVWRKFITSIYYNIMTEISQRLRIHSGATRKYIRDNMLVVKKQDFYFWVGAGFWILLPSNTLYGCIIAYIHKALLQVLLNSLNNQNR